MSAEDLYQITLTGAQLEALNNAAESMARLRMGQFDRALQFCVEDRENIPQNYIDHDTLKSVEKLMKPLMGLASNASFGVSRDFNIDTLWDIHQVLRHQIAWDNARENNYVRPDGSRDFSQMMGVIYDDPFLYSGLPKVLVKKMDVSGSES